MKEEREAVKKATRKKRKEVSSESDGSSEESGSDATPSMRKKAKASDTELPPTKRRSSPYSYIFSRHR
jgi:hypothetical protein